MTGIDNLDFPPIFPLDGSEPVSSGLSVVPEVPVHIDKGVTILPLDDFSLDTTPSISTHEVVDKTGNEANVVLMGSGSSESILGFELAPPDLDMLPSIVEGASSKSVPQKRRNDVLEFPTLFVIEEPILSPEKLKKEEPTISDLSAPVNCVPIPKNGRESHDNAVVQGKDTDNIVVYSPLEFGNARKYLKNIQDLNARLVQLSVDDTMLGINEIKEEVSRIANASTTPFDEVRKEASKVRNILISKTNEVREEISKVASILFYIIEATGVYLDYKKLWESRKEKYIQQVRAKKTFFGKNIENQAYDIFLGKMYINKEKKLDSLEKYMNSEDCAFVVGIVYDGDNKMKMPNFNEKQTEEFEFLFNFYNEKYIALKKYLNNLVRQRADLDWQENKVRIRENIAESEVHFGLVGNPPEFPENTATELHIASQNHRKKLQERRDENRQEREG